MPPQPNYLDPRNLQVPITSGSATVLPDPDIAFPASGQETAPQHSAEGMQGSTRSRPAAAEKISMSVKDATSIPPRKKAEVSKSASDSTASLQFVNTNGPSEKENADSRKLVRAHVMREFRRKQRLEKIHSDDGDVAEEPPSRKAKTTRREVARSRGVRGGTENSNDSSSEASSGKLSQSTAVTSISNQHDLQPHYQNDPRSRSRGTRYSTPHWAPELTNDHETLAIEESPNATIDFSRPPSSSSTRSEAESHFANSVNDAGKDWQLYDDDTFAPRLLAPTPQVLGASRIDPFGQLPLGPSNLELRYLDHWITILAPGMCDPTSEPSLTSPAKSFWLQLVTNDDTLLYVTLYAAAVHIDVMKDVKYSREHLAFEREAIRRINRNIRDPAQAVGNKLIGAILFLASFVNVSGALKAMSAHLDGIEQMINLRGGIEHLQDDEMLTRSLKFNDLLQSALSGMNPKFSIIESPTSKQSTSGFSPDYAWPTFTPEWLSGELLPIKGFHEDTTQILLDISELTAILGKLNELDPPPDFIFANLMTRRSTIERRLLSLPSASIPYNNPHFEDYIYESCRLAALIHLNAVIYLTPFSSQTNHESMKQLRVALEKTDLDSCWHSCSWLLIWPLTIGGASALRDRERSYFIAHLVRVGMAVPPIIWEEVQRSLSRFVWIQSLMGNPMMLDDRIFEEILGES
ncbi:MAG: hypothetical protein M1827_004097 [Pycnora praestabilis]|nr:MAG: hypothetical protein M1827_004097 [Pycnora praestabilis]